jgi:hypothetical protein
MGVELGDATEVLRGGDAGRGEIKMTEETRYIGYKCEACGSTVASHDPMVDSQGRNVCVDCRDASRLSSLGDNNATESPPPLPLMTVDEPEEPKLPPPPKMPRITKPLPFDGHLPGWMCDCGIWNGQTLGSHLTAGRDKCRACDKPAPDPQALTGTGRYELLTCIAWQQAELATLRETLNTARARGDELRDEVVVLKERLARALERG